jgi:hypothetical protein
MQMKDPVKKILKPFVPQGILNIYKQQRQKRELLAWQKEGCYTPPPHLVKQLTIKVYQQKYNCSTLIETGTYMGEMVEALKTRFKKIISIELAMELYEKAKRRFKPDKNVVILQGDSGKVLPEILPEITDPAIFWLDGHFSNGPTAKGDKECPIFEELNSIFTSQRLNHILLIDDARCFVGKDDYPTIESLIDFIKGKNDRYQVEVKHDIIRCVTH